MSGLRVGLNPEAATKTPPKVVTFRIRRYNPASGREWWQEYKVETTRGMTVLDALLKIKEEIDHTLVMRYSCRMGVCGSCGVVINGTPALACQVQVAEVADESNPVVTVEPLYNFPVIRDLVTDFTGFFEKHRKVKPYLIRNDTEEQEDPKGQYYVSPDEFQYMEEFTLCISCGLCYAACPVAASDPEFLGPQALGYLFRYVIDPRDEAWEMRLMIADDEHGCHRCHYAGTCSMVCPKVVDPAQAIQRLRSTLYKYRLGLLRKKKTSKLAPPPKEWKPRKPLPPEAELVEPTINLKKLEEEPVEIEIEGRKIRLRHKIYE